MKRLILGISLLLSACASGTAFVPQVVKVPTPIPCNAEEPKKPIFALDTAAVTDRLFDKGKKALAEIEQRKAYEEELLASLKACKGVDAPEGKK